METNLTYVKSYRFIWKLGLPFFCLFFFSQAACAEYYLVRSTPEPYPPNRCFSRCEEFRPCYYKTIYIHSSAPRRHQPQHAGTNEYEWIDP